MTYALFSNHYQLSDEFGGRFTPAQTWESAVDFLADFAGGARKNGCEIVQEVTVDGNARTASFIFVGAKSNTEITVTVQPFAE